MRQMASELLTTKNTKHTLKSEVKDVCSPAKNRVTRKENPPIKVYFLADFRGFRETALVPFLDINEESARQRLSFRCGSVGKKCSGEVTADGARR